ncbi:ubiquitin conjugating enzyme [Dunaliella salina]|uniref:Ubiquitin conjugating enzyme n=1 Tax=Dunaliella salina TaxID=3046 RepID=A0ABQ7HAD1_DUNSA|nr:ubiquitin conjugating enzyme [Dunaliella salina]|eukprot:KAF5843812.1 ubiquitin conjugating enzyme [Dunaliella salina]
MTLDAGRINKELKEISKDVASGVEVQLRGSGLNKLVGYVPGPKDTPYEGGRYEVDINLDEQYPFVPPKMRFVTKVWHPNISSANGAICLDVLKDQWSPALTIKTALLSLQALLSSPQPDDPQDAVVAKQYLDDRKLFERTARHWTEAFAIPKNEDEVCMRIMEMGFSKEAAQKALKEANGDENIALEKLLG